LQSLKKEVADKVSQRLTFIEIHTVQHPSGRVLLFEIPAARQGLPVGWEGHYYGRDGESLGPLSLEEIERIRRQNRLQDWSAGLCPGACLADLSEEAIALARREYATKHPKLAGELTDWTDETFLNKAKVTIQGQITRTAILLLGKPEAAHWLNPASPTLSWILKDRDGFERDYQHFSCPLLVSADEVYRKIRNLKYRYMSESSLFPEEVDQYDPFIIREALNMPLLTKTTSWAARCQWSNSKTGDFASVTPATSFPAQWNK
jgi:ATP-dependent DNA helicase RecG